jgi:hypothetical protein
MPGCKLRSDCDLLAGRAPDEGNFFLIPDEEAQLASVGLDACLKTLNFRIAFTSRDLSRRLKLGCVTRANPPANPRLAVDVFHS